jgi:hypothetical protein
MICTAMGIHQLPGVRGTHTKIGLSLSIVDPLGALLQEYDSRNKRHQDHILYYM